MMFMGLFELLILLALAGGVVAVVVAVVKGRGRPRGGPSRKGPVCSNADCGAQNEEGARFCRRCGGRLDVG